MKTGKYTLREFFSNRDLNTIIVPEIQRDYVWGKEQIKKLMESIIDDFVEYKNPGKLKSIQCNPNDKDVQLEFEKYYKKNYLSSNIGFIYAYSDSDYPGSYFLIDGQQRFTTIFLTLLVLAANGDDEQLNKFNRVFLNEEKPKLDYRVREASHIFMSKLVQTIGLAGNELSSNWIKKQSWYLQDYDNDVTISSVIKNIDVITGFLKDNQIIKTDESSVDRDFVEYVEDYLEFWYFDTNISEQGEELYIYMNARGESMQEHENLKADLIGKLKDSEMKKEYGKKWEIWQDLFWRNRNKGKNANADNGFNEFLCCIAGLENFFNSKKSFVEAGKNIPYDNKKDLLSMELIEQYWDGFSNLFLEKNILDFSSGYSYFAWIEKAKKEFWNIFNDNKTNWFANYRDDNRATERNRMVYAWSLLYYMKSLKGKEESLDHIYRTLRLFYMRYNNNYRAVDTSIGHVINILEDGPWSSDILNEEESKKYSFLSGKGKEYEELIWKIEDHPLNLNGRDVGGKNCSHLVDFDKNPTVEILQNIYNRFCEIFPIVGDKYKKNHPKQLLNALIFTSIFNCDAKPFWDNENKGYYERLVFDRENRYIRGLSTYGENNVFKTFFDHFKDGNYIRKTKEEVEAKMEKEIEKDKVSVSKIIWVLAWYAASLERKMWEQGYYIAFNRSYYFENRIEDKLFPGIYLENFKGDFRGGSPVLLSSLI